MNKFLSLFVLPSPSRLQPWEKEYFRHLQAEWAVLDIPATEPDAIRIQALINSFNTKDSADAASGTRKDIRRYHLLEFEQTLLRRRSTVSLIQIAPVLRQRFHDVVGDRIFAAYRPTEMPDCATADPKAHTTLYDDLATVVGAIHWRYILYPFNSQTRTTLTFQALIWMLFYAFLWAVTIYRIQRYPDGPFVAVFLTCLFAGVLGGFISALRRMQSVGDDSDSVFVIQGIRAARFWLWFSPLLGGVFAAVALLFFLSGVLGGSIFPAFHTPVDFACGQQPADCLVPTWWFWRHLLPLSQTDYAKLFLWCFISGFAERLIPDMIDNLMNRVDSSRPGAAAPSTPVSVNSRAPVQAVVLGGLTGAPAPGVPPGVAAAELEAAPESAPETAPGTTTD